LHTLSTISEIIPRKEASHIPPQISLSILAGVRWSEFPAGTLQAHTGTFRGFEAHPALCPGGGTDRRRGPWDGSFGGLPGAGIEPARGISLAGF